MPVKYDPRTRTQEHPRWDHIHIRFPRETFDRIGEIADVTGVSLSQTVVNLCEMVLPYFSIKEVQEPRKTVVCSLPESDAKGGCTP